MTLRLSLATTALVVLSFGCRGCDDQTQQVKPVLAVQPTRLDFGKVKVGESAELTVTLTSQSQASVSILGVSVKDGPVAGAAQGYEFLDVPEIVPQLEETTFRVRFRPTARQAYDGRLVVASNDEERPEIAIPLSGEGAHPQMAVIPECSAQLLCKGSVTLDPPAIDFGEEPFQRQMPLPVTRLPKLNVINEGDVPLVATTLRIEGPDAAAFTFEGIGTLPSGGLTLGAGEGVNLSIRFEPTSEAQDDYAAEVVVGGDDPETPEVRVALTGRLGDNLPPVVCANIIRVEPGDGSPAISYTSRAHWEPLLVPPPGGYDFTGSRDVQPRSLVTFSALSDAANPAACTFDPEDGRQGLTWSWTLLQAPPEAGNLAIGGAANHTATMRPMATGEYVVGLTVSDAQGHSTSTTLKFVAVLKEDLVVQLSWGGFANVDLDLHLVRPSSTIPNDPFSGVFSYFDEGDNGSTSGDLNGWSYATYANNPGLGFDFDWGDPGLADDPRLNVDDIGGGQQLEIISLNYPENDPACATEPCAYRVYAHFFNDGRPPGGACQVTSSCADGKTCDCTGVGERCVAAAAPSGTSPSGSGQCFVAPRPTVKVFFKANPVPAAVIPLDTLDPPDPLAIGAPCHMLYVADIVWPARSGADAGTGAEPRVDVKGADQAGYIVSPQLARFGIRQSGSRQCARNDTRMSLDDWYAREPL